MTRPEGWRVGLGGDAAQPREPLSDARLSTEGGRPSRRTGGTKTRPPKGQHRRPPTDHRDGRLRLEARGFHAIPDAELLTHLLALIADGADAEAHAERLLYRFESLTGVITASADQLQAVTGLDAHRLLILRLVWELAARLAWQETVREPLLVTSPGLLGYCQVRLARERVDQVRLLSLDADNRLIADDRIRVGTVGHVEIDRQEILRRALQRDASKIVVARGHVAGGAHLSGLERADVRTLEAAGKSLGIHLVDYLVIGRESHTSYRSSKNNSW